MPVTITEALRRLDRKPNDDEPPEKSEV